MNIENILVAPTSNVKEEICKMLEDNLIAYQKGCCGFFIWIPDIFNELVSKNIPHELYDLFLIAKTNNCNWLYIECNADRQKAKFTQ